MGMQLIHVAILLVTGAGVGFVSGLLGVGGCFITIPVQFWVLTSIGINPKIAILVAFGTNLLVVFPTALSGALGHTRKNAVLWRQAITMGVSGAVAAMLGAYVATLLPAIILKTIFGIAIIIGGVRLLTAKPPKIKEQPPNRLLPYILWGVPLGFFCGLIGIGGGVVMVPVMVIALKFKMHKAVGTSTAMMIFTSIGGIISYIMNGLGVSGLPEYSIGYVNLLQWGCLAGTSIPTAQIGVKVAHKLPAKQLKYVFVTVMFYMGLKMIGVFGWLHLPI